MPEMELQKYFNQGQFRQAVDFMLRNYNPSVERTVNYDMGLDISNYWLKNLKKIDLSDNPIEIWDHFLTYYNQRYGENPDPILFSISDFVMYKIYGRYASWCISPEDKSSFKKKLGMARSLLWMNKVNQLLSYLKSLTKNYPLKSEAWGLLGKAYSLVSDDKKSLLCFRESFFINPSVLNLMDIKSPLIEQILNFYKATFQEKKDLQTPSLYMQWVGISGVIGKFFHLRREFSAEELNDLDQRIAVYENKYKSYKKEEDYLNLVRLYVFKIDYFLSQDKEAAVSGELKKLQNLEPAVYKKIKE